MPKKELKEDVEKVETESVMAEEAVEVKEAKEVIENRPVDYKGYMISSLKEFPNHPHYHLVKEYEDLYGEI